MEQVFGYVKNQKCNVNEMISFLSKGHNSFLLFLEAEINFIGTTKKCLPFFFIPKWSLKKQNKQTKKKKHHLPY